MTSQTTNKFIKYIGYGYALLECEKGHQFKYKLKVNEPAFCPECEGLLPKKRSNNK